MKRQFSGLLGILAGLGLTAAGCKDNPVTDGSGTPVMVSANFAAGTIPVTKVGQVTATVLDKYNTPIPASITAASSACSPSTPADTGAITVAADPTYQPVPNTSTRFNITATHVGRRCVTFSSSGATSATTTITVN